MSNQSYNNFLLFCFFSDAKSIVDTLHKKILATWKHKEEYQNILNVKNKISNLKILFMSKRAKKAADYLVQMAYTHRKELFFEGGASVDPKLDNIVKKEREI
jgi:hypothetical protein